MYNFLTYKVVQMYKSQQQMINQNQVKENDSDENEED
jgi:hypothetical protein